MVNLFTLYGVAFVTSFLVMFFLWIAYKTQKSGGIVDIGWGICFILTAWGGLILGDGAFTKRFFMTAMVTMWGGRLSWHLFQRYLRTNEDARYAKMREAWGGDPSNMLFLMMFLFQAILTVLISTPIIIVSAWSTPEWSSAEFIGMILWLAGVAGESYADQQLREFKANQANSGKVCDVGLWRFSRHPNYFFEFVVWIGIFLFGYNSPGGLLGIISPIIMYVLLVKGSGIPPAEEQSLLHYGNDYKEYQKRTSPFFPWLPGPK